MSRFEIFTRFPLFKGLETDEMFPILARISLDFDTFQEKDVICRKGEQSKGLLLLVEGTAEIDGTRLEAPSLLQYSHLFGSDTSVPNTATALSQCSVMYISSRALLELIHSNAKVLSNYLALLSDDNNK